MDKLPPSLEDRAAYRKRLVHDGEWIIESLLPAGNVHFLAGGSGAGKTTWLMQQMYEWAQGKDVLGFKSHPCDWAYISCDRGVRDISETLNRLGLLHWDAPLYAIEELIDFSQGLSIEHILNHSLFTNTKFFIFEAFQALIPDAARGISQNKSDIIWMAQLRERLHFTNRTVLAVTHPPKQKESDGFKSKRSNILGSVSIGATAGTMIWVDSLKATNDEEAKAEGIITADQRIVNIDLRNAKALEIVYDLDEKGRFINPSIGHSVKEALSEASSTAVNHTNLDMWLLSQPLKEYTTKEMIQTVSGSFQISESTIKRWIKSATERGVLVCTRYGHYSKAFSSPSSSSSSSSSSSVVQ